MGKLRLCKKNAIELAKKELAKILRNNNVGSLFLSSVTDPYQGVESKYKLTRGILEELVKIKYSGRVKILTKSLMVTRDIDLLLKLPNAEVGMSITTTSNNLSGWLEPKAPKPSSRFKTLKILNEAGISTLVFVAPLLPHFVNKTDLLDDLFKEISLCGVKEIYVDNLNLKPYILERMRVFLKNESQETKKGYKLATTKEYQQKLNERVAFLLEKYKLNLKVDEVVNNSVLQQRDLFG